MTLHGSRRRIEVESAGKSLRAWQDRFRDPALTLLLGLELCLIFFAAPLAAGGLPEARPIIETMVLAVALVVGMLSHRRGAIAAIVLGLAAMLASVSPGSEWSPAAAGVLHRGGTILTFSALSWVLSHAVYAPGRVTSHRLQGAVVIYLNIATIFASAFSLIRELDPAAFAGPPIGGRRCRRARHDAVFQPDDADDHRVWRHRAGQPVRPQPGQSRSR